MLQLLRTVYPQACLISEIVSVEEGNYLIRALLQIEGITIANAFAVNRDLEVAQDKALERLFKILEIALDPVPKLELPQRHPLDNGNYVDATFPPLTPVKAVPPKNEAIPSLAIAPVTENLATTEVEFPKANSESQPSPSAEISFSATNKSLTEPSTSALPVPSATRSELLNLTQLEIKRLNWTNKQGSEYLNGKYQKKVRNELTDAELQEFCNYLQSLT